MNASNRLKLAVLALVVISGCANQPGYRGYGAGWEPVVDVRPEQQASYYTDLAECQQLASRVMGAGESAAAGAIVGAIFGALLGAAAGGDSHFNSHMAGVGALSGAAGAAGAAEGDQRGITRNCLAGRGYRVLN